MSKPLVTIIIPTYNRANYISRAIESVINQTYSNIEIFVIDDGSTDSTFSIVSSYDNVRYICQLHKRQAAARNNGLKHANGVYIASLDSDDYWHPDFLSTCIEKLESDSLDFVFTNWWQDIGDGKFTNRQEICEILSTLPIGGEEWLELDSEQLRNMYLIGCPSPSSSVVIKRQAIVKGWTESLHIADDWSMLMDIVFTKNSNAAFTPRLLWTKNTDGSNICDGRSPDEVTELLWIRDRSMLYNRFANNFTSKEKVSFKKSLVTSMLIHAYCELKFRKQFFKSLRWFKSAVLINSTDVMSILSRKLIVKTIKLASAKNFSRNIKK